MTDEICLIEEKNETISHRPSIDVGVSHTRPAEPELTTRSFSTEAKRSDGVQRLVSGCATGPK